LRRYFILTTKKCRIYAAFGVSQTPIYYKKRKEECLMDNETINEMEQTTKELDLSAEEIQGYIACSNRTQYCLTDCPWPFDGAYLSGID
jgi:hypothetical protein